MAAWLGLVGAAGAQAGPPTASAPVSTASDRAGAHATGHGDDDTQRESGGAPIVVTSPPALAPGEKPSGWKRADADHVVVYSDGGEEQLRRVTANLEKLHDLLERLYRARGKGEEPAPLTVVLFDSRASMRKLGLSNPRAEDGPFVEPFAAQRYYDPRTQGSVLALARLDQVVTLDTARVRDADCRDYMAENAEECPPSIFTHTFHPPFNRSWEAVLYGAYAQHMVVNYAPAAYPRWFFDGIGALFSTVEFRGDGSVEYGREPEKYRDVLRSYGSLDTAGVLTGAYLRDPSTRMAWTPYHAWLLTHFFVLSDLKGPERMQFAQYMSALAHGKSSAQAAAAFGTMKRLRYALRSYAGRPHTYARTAKAGSEPPPPISQLSIPAADAMLSTLPPAAAGRAESGSGSARAKS